MRLILTFLVAMTSCALAHELLSVYKPDRDVYCVEEFQRGDNAGFSGDNASPKSVCCYQNTSSVQPAHATYFEGVKSTLAFWARLFFVFILFLAVFANDKSGRSFGRLIVAHRRRYFHIRHSIGSRR
jgi:hypothetical protein